MGPRKRKPGDAHSQETNSSKRSQHDKDLKLQRKLEQSQSSSVYHGLFLASKYTLLIIVLFGIAIYIKNLVNFDKVPLEEELEVTEASVLRQYSIIVRDCYMAQEALINALREEPVAELIKTELRPIQERLASLLTQTGIYEKMERIPGGPKNFIDTTIAELDSLQAKIDPIDIEVFRIRFESKDRQAELAFSEFNVETSQALLYEMFDENPYIFEHLARKGLDLFPSNESIEATEDEDVLKFLQYIVDQEMDFVIGEGPELSDRLEYASTVFEKKSELYYQIKEAYESVGATTWREGLRNRTFFKKWSEDPRWAHLPGEFEDVIAELEMMVEEEGEYFSHTVGWIQKANFLRISLIRMMNKNIKGSKTNIYIELRNQVSMDINNLRARVENLQNNLFKVHPEIVVEVRV